MINLRCLLLLSLLCVLKAIETSGCTGCIQLDEYTFDKLINKFDATLVKFDVAFPYGDKHEAFAKLAKDAKNHDDLLVAEVGIKDYGERDNEELAKRYGVVKDDYPVVKLFIRGKKDPVTFTDEDFSTANLRNFLKKYSGIHLSLPGCIPGLDKLAINFIAASSEGKESLLNEAEKIISKLKDKDKKTAKVYELVMKRIIEKGEAFVKTENERLNKLLDRKVSEEKKKELSLKINIIASFLNFEEKKSKTEL